MAYMVAHRTGVKGTLKRYPDGVVIDVTSKGDLPWRRFSPFYPHWDIPIPLTPGKTASSVEGIWQALKVFEHEDIDPSKLRVNDMKGIKRSASKERGKVLGHRAGLEGKGLLSYIPARWRIYLPAYRWVLDNKLQWETQRLRELGKDRMVILLDYEKNHDITDPSSPLSHAALVKRYMEDDWPRQEERH